MTIHKQDIGLILVLAAVAFVFFLLPFFSFHQGLPTGDSQKSIIWAQQILATSHLPNYQAAIANLNRDPIDFYTPVLHLLTALILKIGGLPGVGIFAIILSLATAAVGACLAYHFLPATARRLAPPLTFILILTHERFLRYIREPGYHFQNIVGEFLLFSLLLFGLSLIRRWRWSTFAAAGLTAALLALSHQFSFFLAGFALIPVFIALAITYRRAAFTLAPLLAMFLIAGFSLGLHHKLPDIFSASPHLLPQTPGVFKILDLMGPAWTLLGAGGLVLLIKHTREAATRTLGISFIVLLLLSQAPRFSIDIPPVRALLYSVIPLSITGAYLLSRLLQQKYIVRLITIILVATFATISTTKAFALSHSVRTNSTLTPGILELASDIKSGVLIDDYNRRSASWLVLSEHPMFTRIAADLETQMNETHQSPLRRQLYLNQLDYEKIFSLGSLPGITQLMTKQNIGYLTGIDGSSDSSFPHNPALQAVKKIDDITLYKFSSPAGTEGSWLLKSSTLANDIGDLEDTFKHLPASLSATRLSDPQVAGQTTFRTTTAPIIPLKFNVGDYVRVLWDQDNDRKPDTSLELLVKYTDHEEQQKILPEEASIDEDGFITLTVSNPEQKPLHFDLIALGLAHTP